ncbi:MAG: hypothetical protein R3F31_03710 [Verrucomicrobiales bacterium]
MADLGKGIAASATGDFQRARPSIDQNGARRISRILVSPMANLGRESAPLPPANTTPVALTIETSPVWAVASPAVVRLPPCPICA